MDAFKKHVPNSLTVIRMGLAVMFIYFHLTHAPTLAFLCILVGCLTDAFDGYLARLWNATSEIGKIIDAYADKFICWAMTVILIVTYDFHPVLIAIVLVQAIYDGGLTYLRYFKRRVDIPVNNHAKRKTIFLMAGFILLYGGWIIGSPPIVTYTAYLSLIIAMSLAIASIATYLRGYKLGWLIPYPINLII